MSSFAISARCNEVATKSKPMRAAEDEPNIRYNSFQDGGRDGLEMKAANTASSQHGFTFAGGSSCACLCHYLREFDQVAGRVREKGQLAADGVELERLGHDLDTASSEIGDGFLDLRHVDAEVVIAGVAQTIAKVGILGSVDRQRIAATQQFDQEGVVVRGCDIGELLIGIGPFVHDPEI